MKSANYAPVYCALYPQLAETARDHGYALCIHGSLGRDMDLVCVPWVEAPSTPGAVVEAITSKFSLKVVGDAGYKLHGRISYVISIAFGECFIDLSFMAAQTPMQKVAVPPPGVDMQEVMYAYGWNDACEKFGNPVYEPTPPVVIEVTHYTDTPPPRLTDAEIFALCKSVPDTFNVMKYHRAIESAVRKQFGYD